MSVCICVGIQVPQCTCRDQSTACKYQFFSETVLVQVIRRDGKHFYLRSHLAGPIASPLILY